jgi:hypothetical protein
VVSPNDFASLKQLSETLLAFVNRYNQTANPFNWKFTAADLTDLLRRISLRCHPLSKPPAGCQLASGRASAGFPPPEPAWVANRRGTITSTAIRVATADAASPRYTSWVPAAIAARR